MDLREVLNAIFDVLKTGCQWDMPHDFPPKGTVYDYFSKWSKDGAWERMNAKLHGQVRLESDKKYPLVAQS